MSHIIETVTFRAAGNVEDAQVISHVKALENYAPYKAGVLSSSLYKDAEGTWHEHYIWRDEAAYKLAFEGFMAAPEGQALLALIDKDSVKMSHRPADASYLAA